MMPEKKRGRVKNGGAGEGGTGGGSWKGRGWRARGRWRGSHITHNQSRRNKQEKSHLHKSLWSYRLFHGTASHLSLLTHPQGSALNTQEKAKTEMISTRLYIIHACQKRKEVGLKEEGAEGRGTRWGGAGGREGEGGEGRDGGGTHNSCN